MPDTKILVMRPGERVRLRWHGDQEMAQLEFGLELRTVGNGGLEPRRNGWLAAVLQLPATPGDYPYRWWDGRVEEKGVIRVRGQVPTTPTQQPQPSPAPPQRTEDAVQVRLGTRTRVTHGKA